MLIEQVTVLDPSTDEAPQTLDVWIEENKIKALGEDLGVPSETRRRDGRGCFLGPGLVDLYSYSGEPGFEYRETLASFCAAAIAGGFTQVNILPETIPPLDCPAVISSLQTKATQIDPTPEVRFWGAVTQGLQGQHLVEYHELAPLVTGFSDGKPIANWRLLEQFLTYIQPLELPVALMPVNAAIQDQGVIRESSYALRYGLIADPIASETTAIAALLALVDSLGTPLHLMRISTAAGLELIAQAKAQGLPITASTSWLHLLKETPDLVNFDPNLRLAPPLGNPTDRAALIDGLANGTLDAIAVDHRPYSFEEKTVPFSVAPPGSLGLELALPLLWSEFVVEREWSPVELWRVLSTGPLRCLGQTASRLRDSEQLVLFDPQTQWTVRPPALKSLSRNSPWWNTSLIGKVSQVWLSN